MNSCIRYDKRNCHRFNFILYCFKKYKKLKGDK